MNKNAIRITASAVVVGIMLLALVLWGLPVYKVWASGLGGQAKLKRAEQEKLIMIEHAKAEVASAKLRAEAIAVVGDAVQQYPEYRLQEFIGAFGDAMENGAIQKIIYVPTEANIPIVEAGRIGSER